jgi:hypothetical protein
MDKPLPFSSKSCSLREHEMWAFAASDGALQVARPPVLKESFEKEQMVERRWNQHQRRNRKVQHRLHGFGGMRFWAYGMVRFSVCSPDLPFFGAEASRLCPDVPIMYRSLADNGRTPWRFFVGGREFDRGVIPPTFEEKFAKLEQLGSGFVLDRKNLAAYLCK